MSKRYVVGNEYRDRGMKYRKHGDDEFQSWLTEAVPDGESAFIPMKAIKPLRNYSENDEIGEFAAFILVSARDDEKYPDRIYPEKGMIKYWGDARRQSPDEKINIDSFYGNQRLRPEYEKIKSGNINKCAPILFFEKPQPGYVRFRGLCVLETVTVDKYLQNFDEGNVWTPNYLFHLAILDTESVPLEWINNRVKKGTDKGSPDIWDEWKKQNGETSSDIRHTEQPRVQKRERGSSTDGRIQEYSGQRVEVSESFRERVFHIYNEKCLFTQMKGSPLVTLSHIVPRSKDIEYAEDINNVFLLNWTHHMAFDNDIFTFDSELRLLVNPEFETRDPHLQRTIVEREGEKIELPDEAHISSQRIEEHNENVDWYPIK